MKKTLVALIALLSLVAGNAFALTYTSYIQDKWVDWPGYTSSLEVNDPDNESVDSTPLVDSMRVDVVGGLLKTVAINFGDAQRIADALFINNTYNSDPDDFQQWNYFVIDTIWDHDFYQTNSFGTVAQTGFYSVADEFTSANYTLTEGDDGLRPNTPNGIDAGVLENLDEVVGYDSSSNSDIWDSRVDRIVHSSSLHTLVYDFEGLNIDATGGLFIAYSQWCGNDVMGGYAVPEPGSMLLFGSGLLSLGLYRRFRKN